MSHGQRKIRSLSQEEWQQILFKVLVGFRSGSHAGHFLGTGNSI